MTKCYVNALSQSKGVLAYLLQCKLRGKGQEVC